MTTQEKLIQNRRAANIVNNFYDTRDKDSGPFQRLDQLSKLLAKEQLDIL